MKKFITALLVLGGLTALLFWKGFRSNIFLSPPEIRGGVMRVADEKGDRLYYLTTQWEKRIFRTGSRSSSSSARTVGWCNTDLWELDATTAQPVVRRRLKREKANGDVVAMGMEQGIMWARIPELVGIRVSDGAIVVDKAKIEAANPSLANLVPKPPEAGIFLTESMQPLRFSPMGGMIVRLDDARWVRIDPLTLEATPSTEPRESWREEEENPNTPPRGMRGVTLAHGMDWYSMVRDITVARKGGGQEWLGLLADTELELMKERHTTTHQMDFTSPRRHRLYRAGLKKEETFMGARWIYENPTALPESPEFLMGGLLTSESGGLGSVNDKTALTGRDPDSVFVLSRDRLGDDGRMQIARIAGPEGRVVWSTPLPLSALSAWMPAETHAVMLGPCPSAERSPTAEKGENPSQHILSVDLKTGELKSFNPDLNRNWQVIGDGGAVR